MFGTSVGGLGLTVVWTVVVVVWIGAGCGVVEAAGDDSRDVGDGVTWFIKSERYLQLLKQTYEPLLQIVNCNYADYVEFIISSLKLFQRAAKE